MAVGAFELSGQFSAHLFGMGWSIGNWNRSVECQVCEHQRTASKRKFYVYCHLFRPLQRYVVALYSLHLHSFFLHTKMDLFKLLRNMTKRARQLLFVSWNSCKVPIVLSETSFVVKLQFAIFCSILNRSIFVCVTLWSAAYDFQRSIYTYFVRSNITSSHGNVMINDSHFNFFFYLWNTQIQYKFDFV